MNNHLMNKQTFKQKIAYTYSGLRFCVHVRNYKKFEIIKLYQDMII